MIPDWLVNFHFLRPLWLLAIIPAIVVTVLLLQKKIRSANWQGAINSSLLEHLSDGMKGSASRAPWYALGLALSLTAIALAGPTWNKLPQPVHQRQDALVIVLDLSLSMLAEDIKPSRLIRARHKILDILAQRQEGLTALVAYSGDAHVVTPLTDDTPTIANLVPALSPLMMPVTGSDPVTALEMAQSLFTSSGFAEGRILLITDGVTEQDVDALDDSLHRSGLELSILAVATRDGAPIPADQGYLKDVDGNIIVPQLDSSSLEALAANNRGRYTTITLNDRDLQFLLPPTLEGLSEATVITEREFDQWQDAGPWLTLFIVPFALMAFRRGWLLTLTLPLLFTPETSVALEWQDLWQRADQQGAQQLQNGDAEAAAKTFEDPAWKASAQYRAQQFDAAADTFATLNTAEAHFNRGNALAKAGKLEDAIAAYDEALQLDSSLEDAQFNRELVKQLLERQNQQNQQQNGEQDNSEQQSSDNNQNQQGDSQASNSDSSEQSSQSESSSSESESSPKQEQKNPEPKNASESQQASPETAQQDQQTPASSDQQQDESEQAQQRQQAQAEASEQPDDAEQATSQQAMQAQSEQQQATEQWLRQIPDDPAGLLQRKFNYESQRRQRQGNTQREQPRW